MTDTDDSQPSHNQAAATGSSALPPLNLDGAVTTSGRTAARTSKRPKSVTVAAVSLLIAGLCWLGTPLVLWIYLRSLVRNVVQESTGTARSTLIEWVQSISPQLLHGAVEQLGDQQIVQAVSKLLFDQIAGSAWLLIGLALVFFAGYLVTALTVWKRKRTARLITTILIAIAYIPLIVAVILLVLSRFGLSLFGGLAGGITTWISDLIAQWHEAPEMLTETVTEIFATDHAGTLISAIGSMFRSGHYCFLVCLSSTQSQSFCFG